MKIIAYSDGEKIENIVVFDADLSTCLTNLQNEGYLIVAEENIPAPRIKNSNRYSHLYGDERR